LPVRPKSSDSEEKAEGSNLRNEYITKCYVLILKAQYLKQLSPWIKTEIASVESPEISEGYRVLRRDCFKSLKQIRRFPPKGGMLIEATLLFAL